MRVWHGVVMVAVTVGLAGCGGEGESAAARSGGLRVVASIFPVQSLVQQVVGEAGTVDVLMPPGANPHDFSPTPADLAKLGDADVLVVVGLGLDPWAERAVANLGGRGITVLRFSDLVGVRHVHAPVAADADEKAHDGDARAHDAHAADAHAGHDHGHDHANCAANAHLWLDAARAGQFVTELAVQFAALRPDLGPQLQPRAAALGEEIARLDAQWRTQLAAVPVKQLVTFHNAFDPLAQRYGLTVVDHLIDIELAPGGEVTSADLVQAIAAVRKHNLRVIYAEPQFPSKVIDRLRDETGVAVLQLDPEGAPLRPGFESWQAMMTSNVATLVRGQSLQ